MPKTEIALKEFTKIKDKNVSIIAEDIQIMDTINHADMVVDGVFGTGFRGELENRLKNICS